MIEDSFLKLKSSLELTPTFREVVSRKHQAVRGVVERNGSQVKDTKLIGSLHQSRQTRIQPRDGDGFDIDILVILGQFDYWGQSGNGVTPDAAMRHVYGAIGSSDRYNSMSLVADHPTVTFEYQGDGVKVELVPAYVDNIGAHPNGTPYSAARGYWIPSSAGGWELADYDYEAAYISAANDAAGGVLIPLVKMLKAVKREHFASFKSFHLEVIAAEILPGMLNDFRTQGVAVTYPNLVTGLLHRLQGALGAAHVIPGSNSAPFIVPIGAQIELNATIDRLKNRSLAAFSASTDAEKHRIWREIYGDLVPLP